MRRILLSSVVTLAFIAGAPAADSSGSTSPEAEATTQVAFPDGGVEIGVVADAHGVRVPGDELELVGHEPVTSIAIDERSGTALRVDGTAYTFAPKDSGYSTVASCQYIYTVNTPVKSGSPALRYVVGTGSLQVTSGCASSVYAVFQLRMYDQLRYVTKSSHAQTVSPGQTKSFYTSRDCVSESFLESWQTRFSGAAGPRYASLFCSV